MKKVVLVCFAFVGFCASANPDETQLKGFAHWSSAALQSTAQTLAADSAKDAHHLATKQLADFANDALLFAHREADGTPEVHETQVDVMFIQSGAGTLVVGGTLENGETVSPHEKRNGTILGGSRQKVAAGDIVRVPANTPHQMLLDGSHEITYAVVKVKGY
jgi:mannose-6-phosphate isomerase-like protein (cupin superfamily)